MSPTDFAQPVRHTTHQRTSQISIRIALIAAQLAASITAAAAGLLIPVSGPSPVARAAGPITGTVFQDFNANGAQDGIEAGVAGVTVTAWQSGTAPISTTTDANGLYTFTLAGANARVEFTGLPFGFQSSPVGTSTNTSVRFVATPASAVNFGIFQPSAYCQNNPQLITACFTAGDNITGLDQNDTNVFSFPYSASGINPGLQTSLALAKQVGSVFGIAYQRGSGSTFVSAYTKRLASYGPGTGSPTSDGTGTIYRIAADGTVAPFVDLDDLFGPNTTGANPHTSFVPVAGDFDGGAFDAVGKTGLGDIDMGEDDSTLWTVNLADRTLYGLPIGNAAVPVAPTAAQVITSVVPTPACVLGTGRPFAVKPFNGLVYVGGVCTSENDGTSANLLAYVYAYNPATAAWTATPVLQFPMNYPRACVDIFPGYTTVCKQATNGSLAGWLPWSNILDTSFPAGYSQGYAAHPQPMFSGIDFVPNGTSTDMVVAFRDRFGDQIGSVDPGPANDSPRGALLNAVPAGDILRASLNAGAPPVGAWTIESNSSSNPVGAFGPTAGANSFQGPGNGEFYWGDEWAGRHDEIVYGGIVHVSGLSTTVATAMDPLREATSGVIFLNNTDGGAPQTYEVRAPVPYGQINDLDFRKANGMGDIEAMCDSAPIEIGNRVWLDADANGVQDAGESPIAGVQVRLTSSNGGSVVATTDANGEYRFSSAVGTSTANAIYNLSTGTVVLAPLSVYTLTVDTLQAPLATYSLTLLTADPSPNGTARDSNGVLVGGVAVAGVTTGVAGANNHTYDFGFYPAAPPAELLNLGNLVWFDTNNNGTRDAGEVGVDGVTLELYRDVNGDGVFTPGADGPSLGSQTTAGGGIYNFTGLTTGGYVVVISGTQFAPGTPLAGYCNSTSSDSGNTDVDNRNHGNVTGPTTPGVCVLTPANIVASTVVTLTPGGEPPIPVDTDGTNGNLTIDFGFYQPTPPAELLNLGNLVWFDTNNNGTRDTGEVGIDGVSLQLYRDVNGDGVFTPGADGPSLGSQTTAGGGIYNFTGLTTGGYLVVISGTQFAPGAPLYGYCNSTSTDSGNTNIDNRNHGNVSGPTVPGLCLSTANIIASTVVTLTPGGEPPIPVDTDGTNGNLTIDFGFYRMLLGNLVWNDRNRNGTWEPTEPGVPNVTVRLLNPISTVLQSTQTDASGFYTFTGIISSTYCAEVVPPLGYTNTITTPTSGNPNNDVDHDNNGVIISGTANGGTVIRSNCMTMTPGAEPFITTTTGTSANPTLDFGLWQPVVIVLSKNAVPAPSTLTQTIQVGVGTRITYTLSVRNDGAAPALNVVLSDVVPADTAFVAGSANPPATPVSNVISWTVPQLNVGQTAQVSFEVTVVSRNGVAIENTAFALSNQTPMTVSNRVVHVFTPTPITLVNFDATATAGSVMINWGTGLELDTFGFLLYRTATGNQADRVLITAELIPALGGNSSYRFEDKNVTAGTRYTYWLVEVEQSASSQPKMNEQGTTSVTFGVAAVPNPSGNVPVVAGAAGLGGGVMLQGAAGVPANTNPNGDANGLAQAAPQAQSMSKIEAASVAAQPAANTNPTTANAAPVSEPGSVAATGGTNDAGVVADASVQAAQKPVAQLQTQNTSAGLQPAAEASESEAMPAADVAQASKRVAAAQPAEPVQASVQSAAQVKAPAAQAAVQEPARNSNMLWLAMLAGITLVAVAGITLVVGVVRQARRRS